MGRKGRRALVLTPVLSVAFLFYYWTGTTEGDPIRFGAQRDSYNQLTNAFLKGHLSLLQPPPTGLLSLKDPYDPTQNAPWLARFYDLALYHGHFYLTWGPTPVLTLLMPWRLLQVGAMPINLATIIYCCCGVLFATLLLCFLVDRYAPETKPWQIALGTGALALSNVAPFVLRRPLTYELAVSSGYCFAMLGAYLLAIGGLGPRRRPWILALGSLSVGLAVGGRPTLILEGLFPIALFVYLVRRDRPEVRGRALLHLGALLVGPFLVVLGLLFAYNFARFGSILQNGTPYALEVVNQTRLHNFRLSYVAPGLYYYLIARVRWTLAFPYFTLPPPPAYPGLEPYSFYPSEITGGLLTTTPIIASLVLSLPLLFRRRLRELGAVVVALCGVGLLVLVLLSFAFWFTTMRYEADFVSFLLLAALVAWFAVSRLRWRRLVKTLGALAIVYGCVVGAATSLTGYYDGLRTHDPATYWALARLTSSLPTLATMIEGHPVVTRVIEPAPFVKGVAAMGNDGTYAIGTTTFVISQEPVEVDVVSPGTGPWTLRPTFHRAQHLDNVAVDLVVAGRGRPEVVSVGQKARGFVLSLYRGLNRFQLWASAPGVSQLEPLVVANGVGLSSKRPTQTSRARTESFIR